MPNPLDSLPGYALNRAAQAMMAELGSRLAPLDLRIAEASLLLLLGSKAAMTSSEIGRALGIARANMVPLLGRLEAASLIAREPIDRKSLAITLTAAGKRMLKKVETLTRAFEEDLLSRIPAEHRAHFVPALNALWQH
ncbi:MAG: MarR family winged helix-turn-helix transcriptional regulator [Novosphingobium sp.]